MTLKIVGVEAGKTVRSDAKGIIFVPLSGNAAILLSPGEFRVLDSDGTDGAARLQLPVPATAIDGDSTYTVFARASRPVGGSSSTTTCATDPATGEEVCSGAGLVLVDDGLAKFRNVSRELLYAYFDIDGTGDAEYVSVFHGSLQNFFWSYDNNGLELAQLAFYACSTDPVAGTDHCFD